ncbi:MAG: type II toxin-antitoxin system Phd/YefM family antitoxin [Clostridia bacterium]|nr:type II toxin-antitoxin system Phd/YefM family antitoxin [Clostridia bacterium]
MQITATDLKSNLGKYLRLAGREEIQITKNGTAIAVLSAPKQQSSWVDEISDIIPDLKPESDYKEIVADAMWEKYESLS